jgi:hypothetical protein
MATNPFINPELLFNDVPEALEPLEAGVAYESCKDCTNSGGEMTSVPQPHAVYTNEFGKAVIQLNTVVLGGVNGVNN